MKRELGDLEPLRKLQKELADREQQLSPPKKADDEVMQIMREIRAKLTAAMSESSNSLLESGLTIEEYAEQEGITVWGVYRRKKKGKIQTKRVPGRGVVVIAA